MQLNALRSIAVVHVQIYRNAFWCLETVSCVRQASTCTTAVNISMTEDICPRLTSTKVLIQATETENLEINVVNLVRYVRT
ncbi:Hypothetical predicted protein [Mytilus galloprovincialis]|uniref:Uncharacterized protein n=1 Tax=Mytilus galloprovincialis TaxID=29158 RepID=A0A8B6ESV0_MYTGA|nr:Hypothetical predicted protein [Mytilus galloprovincialis]